MNDSQVSKAKDPQTIWDRTAVGQERYLQCMVEDGMFKWEVVVIGETFEGDGFSFFVDRCLLLFPDKKGPNGIKVTVVDIEENCVKVRLPRDPFGNNMSKIARVLERHVLEQGDGLDWDQSENPVFSEHDFNYDAPKDLKQDFREV